MAFSFCEIKRESRYSPVCGLVNAHAPGVCDADSIPFKQKKDHPDGVVFLLVDLKGIEPSNLTDANRALYHASRILSKNEEKNKNERKEKRRICFPLFARCQEISCPAQSAQRDGLCAILVLSKKRDRIQGGRVAGADLV